MGHQVNQKSWNCCNAAGAGTLPVTVYGFLEGPLSQGLCRHPAIRPIVPAVSFKTEMLLPAPPGGQIP
jgi:hypothetical protein